MTRYWPTFVMAGVLAGLAGYLYWVELPAKRTAEEKETQAKQLLSLAEEDVNSITIQTSSGEVMLGREPSGKWKITAPIQTEADHRQVQAFLRALLIGKVTRVVERQPASLAPFGLDHPSAVVTVSAGTQKETIFVGDAGPLSSTLYVLRESDQSVLLTDLAPKDFLNLTLLSFRRKELLQFAHQDVDRLRLTYSTNEILLAAQEDRPKKRWKIIYPIEAEADRTEVQALLFRLEDLRALAIVDQGPEHDTLKKILLKPKVKVVVHAAGEDQVVRLFQPDPAGGEAYAQTTREGPIYKVSPTAIKDLTKELFALQDKRLLGADIADIATLAINTRDEQYVLVRRNDEWTLEDQPTTKLRQDVADLAVSRIANLPAELRILKQASALAPYGLIAPAAEFVATGRNGQVIGRLALGSQVGSLVYAVGHGLQGVFQARADLMTQIPSRLALLGQDPVASKP